MKIYNKWMKDDLTVKETEKLYQDDTTGETWTKSEIGELFDQLKWEMEGWENGSVDDYIEHQIRTGALKEVER